jgi:hypothetical protein
VALTRIARRRLAALTLVSVLTVMLAACSVAAESSDTSEAGSEDSSETSSPSAESDSPTDSPTDTADEPGASAVSDSEPYVEPVFTAVAPSPRVPVTCTQLFTSLAGLSGGSGSPMYEGTPFDAIRAQAGSLHCEISTNLERIPAHIEVLVGVDIPRSHVQSRVDDAVAAGHHTGFGGELSYSNCGKIGAWNPCYSGVYATGYFAEVRISPSGSTNAGLDTASLQFAQSLATRLASWGPAPVAWRAPTEALRWSTGCEAEADRVAAAVADVVPFPIGSATEMSSDWYEFSLFEIADQRSGVTRCQWGVDRNPTVTVMIVPGASWMFAQPGALTGTPYRLSDALAALTVIPVKNGAAVGYSDGTAQVVAHDSLVVVSVTSAYDMPSIPTSQLTTLPVDIAKAIIAELTP